MVSIPQSETLLSRWPIYSAVKDSALAQKERLSKVLSERLHSDDASIVVFGSLARNEWTSQSDLDWTFLIDGQADAEHLKVTQRIQILLDEGDFNKPGQSGVFGNMAFSHSIIHQIGGEDDSNRNTTQRILLLLESFPVGSKIDAHSRVLRAVIRRYVEDDYSLKQHIHRVPRFLLNDIVRFWRTMTVDFARKQRDRGEDGWALRNAKLRFSRKLIFLSGLLVCFSCHAAHAEGDQFQLEEHLLKELSKTPLETVSESLQAYGAPSELSQNLLGGYAAFLEILNDDHKRAHLKHLKRKDASLDPLFAEVRKLSHTYQNAINDLFFRTNTELTMLVEKYGIF
jgi:predicted nucleotidyltransferase